MALSLHSVKTLLSGIPQHIQVYSSLLYYEKSFCSPHVLPLNLLTKTHVSTQQSECHSVLKSSFVTRSCPCLMNWIDLVNLEFEVVYQAISLEKLSSQNVYLPLFWFHCSLFHFDNCYCGKLCDQIDWIQFKFILFKTNWVLIAAVPQISPLLFSFRILNISCSKLFYSHRGLTSLSVHDFLFYFNKITE